MLKTLLTRLNLVCCGSILDSGGASSSYENNSYYEVTLYPSSEHEYVSIEFIHVYIEAVAI